MPAEATATAHATFPVLYRSSSGHHKVRKRRVTNSRRPVPTFNTMKLKIVIGAVALPLLGWLAFRNSPRAISTPLAAPGGLEAVASALHKHGIAVSKQTGSSVVEQRERT